MKNKIKYIWDEYLSGPCAAFYNHLDFEDASPPKAIWMLIANFLGIFLFFGIVLGCIIFVDIPKFIYKALTKKPQAPRA
jgi:hypothetical protein